jgi:hypothetical protein
VSWFSILIEPDWVIEAKEHDHCHQCIPRDFHEDLRKHEGLPGINLGRTLANLIERPLDDKIWHCLLHKLAEYGKEIENSKHLILKSLDGIRGLEK